MSVPTTQVELTQDELHMLLQNLADPRSAMDRGALHSLDTARAKLRAGLAALAGERQEGRLRGA